MNRSGAGMKKSLLELLPFRENTRNKQAPAAGIEGSTASDDIFRTLADKTTDLIIYLHLSPVLRITYVNPAAAAVTGYKPEEFYEDPDLLFNVVHPDDVEAFRDYINRKHPSAGQTSLTIRCYRAGGSLIWLDTTRSAVLDKKNKSLSVLVIARDVTTHIRVEEALRKSQKFSTSLLEHTPLGTMVINPDTTIRYVNPAWEELNGWRLDEVIGLKPPFPWWPEEKIGEMSNLLKQSFTVPAGSTEVVAVKKNGEKYNVLLNWVGVREDGVYRYTLVNALDITEKTRMSDALKESEEVFSIAFRSSPDMMALIDVENSKYLEVNDTFIHATGYSREELLGQTGSPVLLWKNPGDAQKMLDLLQPTGSFRHAEFQFRMKSGEVRTWLCSVDMLTISGKSCMLTVATDITERKMVETALKESEEKFSQAFQASPDAISITEMRGAYLDINDAHVNYFGYTREEVIGKTPLELGLWVDMEAHERFVRDYNRDGYVRSMETEFRTRSGDIRTVLFSLEGISLGGRHCCISVCTDITERKRIEKELADEAARRRILMEHTRDGIVVMDSTGAVYEANPSFAQMLGYTMDEVRRLHVWDWDAHIEPAQLSSMMESVNAAGDHFLTVHRRKDGSLLDVEISTNAAVFDDRKLIFCVCRDVTERKRAEQALRESEERFSKAFQSSPGAISISRLRDGMFIEVNNSFLQDKGYTREEIIGHTALQLNLWTDLEKRNHINRLVKNGAGFRNELVEYRTKDGEIKTGYYSGDIITIDNEPCLIMHTTDITPLKKAEEKLRLLGSITEQVSDSTIITNPDFKITYLNRAACEQLGYTLDEVLGEDLSIFNEDREEDIQAIRDSLRKGNTCTSVVRKQRKDGSLFIAQARTSPLFDDKGAIISYIDIHHDITDLKETESSLQASKDLVESILASMPEGVLVIGADDNVVLANDAFYRIFSIRQRSVVNKPLQDVLPIEPLGDQYRDIKTGGHQERTLEFRYQKKTDEKIIASVITGMPDGRTLLTFSDVSSEREEEAKLYLTDRLASIGEMAAGLAHELNNPLTGILALSQMMMEGDTPESCREDISCIYEEAKRAASIVKNVLLFTRNSRSETGRSSANDVIRDVLRLREYEAQLNGITVVVDLETGLPNSHIDQYQFQQVFLNLVLNAEAAIKEAGRPGVLTVTTSQEGDKVKIDVTDNGCGIKKSVLPRIFDPFFTTKEIGKGTGLGLSICYGIVVKHGGRISVNTRVNEGTTFTVTLPVYTQNEQQEGQA